jgi:hypothetical protein
MAAAMGRRECTPARNTSQDGAPRSLWHSTGGPRAVAPVLEQCPDESRLGVHPGFREHSLEVTANCMYAQSEPHGDLGWRIAFGRFGRDPAFSDGQIESSLKKAESVGSFLGQADADEYPVRRFRRRLGTLRPYEDNRNGLQTQGPPFAVSRHLPLKQDRLRCPVAPFLGPLTQKRLQAGVGRKQFQGPRN